jgi:single-stranded-DNA-specific exonuclease
LSGTARPGLRALLAVSRCDPSGLDASSLGFRLAPRINAAGRMRRADAALELLLTDDPGRAQEIADELDVVNAERRAVEQRIGWEADALVAAMGERSAYVLAGEGWHAGVIGIVASRVVERYHRPAVLIALDGTDPRLPAQGSGRSIPGFDLLAALDSAGGYLLRYGGHRAAAGLSVLPEQIDAVREAIERHAEEVLTPELLEAVEPVDAVVSGSELTLGLAEELLALEPCGSANPAANLLVPGARFGDIRTMGEGKHARFTVSSGGARANAVSFGCGGRVPGAGDESLDASFRLERNVWNGAIEPRLVLRHASACAPAAITVLGEPDDYLTAVVTELERALPRGDRGSDVAATGEPPGGVRSPPAFGAGGDQQRVLLDRRGESPLAVLADAISASEEDGVLAVCADVPRRLSGLRDRAGAFALISHAALSEAPGLLDRFDHVVVLDPPADPGADALTRYGYGYTHFSWGDAELRFAQQMHEQEYGLRASLVALYRSLRERQRVAGEELEHLLRGDGKHARSARLAGRLLRVFTELELVSLDRDLPALALAGAQPTQLERSEAYRAYTRAYEDGQRFLSRARPRMSV